MQNRSGPPDPAQQIRRLDRNHDGKISRSEAPDRLLQRWDRLDRDGDGSLTRGELQTRNDQVRRRTGRPEDERAFRERENGPVGLLTHEPEAFDGYTLFAPIPSTTTYLIDIDGKVVHSWRSEHRPAHSAYLLKNGHLLRTADIGPANQTFRAGGSGGRVEELDWEGNRVWEFVYASDKHLLHHDVEPLPNGNVLMIAWERKTTKEAIAAGRSPALLGPEGLWSDEIIEVEPRRPSGGEIVWRWRVWDHLIQDQDPAKANYGSVVDHPELLDINYCPHPGRGPGAPDWTHFNSVDYNPALDQILVSCHGTSEIFVIDHSTTTRQASGHTGGRSGQGGDILYRWGNPAAHRAGGANDQKLFAQHDAQWIEPALPGAGHILIFNNGQGRPDGPYSSVEEIAPPADANGSYARTPGQPFGPAKAEWRYVADQPTSFFSPNISGAQRLPNGDTLVCSGAQGWFFEVTPAGKLVWQYVSPVKGRPPVGPPGGGPDMGGPGVRGPGMRRGRGSGGPEMGRPGMQPPGRQPPGMGPPGMRPSARDEPNPPGPGVGGRGPGGFGMGPPGRGRPVAPSGPMRDVFRAVRYSPDYPGLAGKKLTPGPTVEQMLAEAGAAEAPRGRPAQPGPAGASDRRPAARDSSDKPPRAAARFHVRAGPTNPSADGTRWETAFASLQEGIDAAERSGGGQVWVARGVYRPTDGSDRNASFRLKPGVEVYGGFAGSEESLDQRNWEKNVTVLSGDIGRPNDPSDNVYHVVVGADHSVLDGFTIAGGDGVSAAGSPRPAPPGAGSSQRPRPPLARPLRGEPRARRAAGAADSSNRQRGPSDRRGERAFSPGGERPSPGAPAPGGGRIHITPEIVLRGPSPGQGAGMINYQCVPTVRNCIFRDNRARKGGAMYNMTARGFPPDSRADSPQPEIIRCRFLRNYAAGRGGAVANDLGTHPVFTGCEFLDNSCDGKGGGIYNDFGCSPTLTQCLFVGNSAFRAGAIGNDGGSSPAITCCTFTRNRAEDLGAALYQGTGPANNPVVTNCILWGDICENGPSEIANWHDCDPTVTGSCVEGGYPGEGNLDADPRFVDPKRGDFRLAADTPCPRAGHTAEPPDVAPARPAFGAPDRRPAEPGPASPPSRFPHQAVVYVNAARPSAAQDGRSWRTAYASLQEAMDRAWGSGGEVWAARGVYLPSPGSDRAASFRLRPGVAVYGGFNGTESARSDRDPGKNATILSGDIGRPGDDSDNCYHVLIGADDALLDGFTITLGRADGRTYDAKGGGMINYRRGPQRGPMAPAVGCSPTLRNCRFVANRAVEGGAIYSFDRCSPVLSGCRFIENSADNGGAIVDRVGVASQMTDCVFEKNRARWRGGALYFDYGSRPQIRRCRFAANRTDGHGGAVYLLSRSSQLENTWPAISDCQFVRNAAKRRGGAIANCDHSLLDLTRCLFEANRAGRGGGALSNDYHTRATVDRCAFRNNAARQGDADIDSDASSSVRILRADDPVGAAWRR